MAYDRHLRDYYMSCGSNFLRGIYNNLHPYFEGSAGKIILGGRAIVQTLWKAHNLQMTGKVSSFFS